MKTFFIILSTCFVLIACNQTKEKQDETSSNSETSLNTNTETSIEFKENQVDIGKIKQGEVVLHTFVFTNTGDEDLLINRVEAACGCTASKYTTDIVKPGETGEVEVKFDSHNRTGKQSKTVTVFANTIPARTVLSFVAEIETIENN